MSGLADERRAVDIVYFDFSETFHTVSHKNLTEKLMNYGLDEHTVRRFGNQLKNQAQTVMISGSKSNWKAGTSGVTQRL